MSSQILLQEFLKGNTSESTISNLNLKDENETIVAAVVNHISESYKEKRAKLKISSEKYKTYLSEFLRLEYTIEQANRVILKRGSYAGIAIIFKSHDKLIALTNRANIIRVASTSCASNQINALLALPLIDGFTSDQLIKILSHSGGSKSLKALECYLSQHPSVEPSERAELIKMLSHIGGSKNLEAWERYLSQHPSIEPSERAELIKILSHGGGSKNLAAWERYLSKHPSVELSERAELIKMLSHIGGSKNLAAWERYLSKHPFVEPSERAELIKMLSHIGGSKNLAAWERYLSQHPSVEPSERAELIKILSHIGGSKNLAAWECYRSQHPSAEPSERAELIKMLSHDGGSKNLAAWERYLSQHPSAEPSERAELIKILSHNGGSKNLAAWERYLSQHPSVEPSERAELIKMLSHIGGSKNLAAWERYLSQHPSIEPSERAELIKILSHNGGSKNLEAWGCYLSQHPSVEPSERAELIKMLSHIGGSKNLAAWERYLSLHPSVEPSERAELIKMLSHSGGSKNLEAWGCYLSQHPSVEPSERAELVKMLSHGGGSKNLAAWERYLSLHPSAEPSERAELIKMLSHGGGSKNLEAWECYLSKHPSVEPSERAELIKILSHDGGSKNLAAWERYLSQHPSVEPSERAELIKILSHSGGSKNLEAWGCYLSLHPSVEPSERAELIKMLSHGGGSKNLEAWECYLSKHPSVGPSEHAELIKILSHDGGSKNLAAWERYLSLHPSVESGERAKLIKILSYDGGSKNLEAWERYLSQHPSIVPSERAELIKILSRAVGYRYLALFIQYHDWFEGYEASEQLIKCCCNRRLNEEALKVVLALTALLYHFKAQDKPILAKFFSLANSSIEIVNSKLNAQLILQKDNDGNYAISSPSDSAGLIKQLEEKLSQYSSSDSVALKQLLHPNNAGRYRLLAKGGIYYLDVRPWKPIFLEDNLPRTMRNLILKGVKDSDIIIEDDSIAEITPSIEIYKEHYLSMPAGIVESIIDDLTACRYYKLVLSEDRPIASEVKPGCVYLYRADKQTLEVLVEKKLGIVFNSSRLTSAQNNELMQVFALNGPEVQLHRSTLAALSQCIEGGRDYPLWGNVGGAIQIVEDHDKFFSDPPDDWVKVYREVNTLASPSVSYQDMQPQSPQARDTEIGAPNSVNNAFYASMPTFASMHNLFFSSNSRKRLGGCIGSEEPARKQLKLGEEEGKNGTVPMREQLDTRFELYSKRQALINRFDGSAILEKASEEHYKASLEELERIKSAKEKKVNGAHVFFELGAYHYHHLPKDCRNQINMVSVNYFLVLGMAVYASRVSNYKLNNDDSVFLSTLLPDLNGLIKCYKNGDTDKLKEMLEALVASNLESPKMRCRL